MRYYCYCIFRLTDSVNCIPSRQYGQMIEDIILGHKNAENTRSLLFDFARVRSSSENHFHNFLSGG